MSDDITIEVRDLTKTYSSGLIRRRRVEALRGISFAVQQGEIFGLLGPNGAGKTTLIKVLLGLVRKGHGEATLLGKPAGDRATRRQVGYLPESHRFPQHHTGASALDYFGGLSDLSSREVRRRTPELLERVGLADWANMPVKKYSKGMQQRLGLAQAMLHEPEVLILDEPTDGVDPVGRRDMRLILQELKGQGKTVFINSHLLQEVELVCDRVAILHHGKVERAGRIDELTKQSQTEFTFVVSASAERARKVLAEHAILHVSGSSPATVRIGAANQAAVDRAVDDLRRAEISILSLTGRRRTLEEAFLEIVGEATALEESFSPNWRDPRTGKALPALDAEILP
ncbi:MAG: ABC transporter ATP-binding protein [Pirellulales bacterium]